LVNFDFSNLELTIPIALRTGRYGLLLSCINVGQRAEKNTLNHRLKHNIDPPAHI
jgi:hypothetical protein